MILLVLSQSGFEMKVGLFNQLEEARQFVEKIPGYQIEHDSGFTYETLLPSLIEDYLEIEHQGHSVPLSRFSFNQDEKIDIDYLDLVNLSQTGSGVISGVTKVDAYHVNNEEVKAYIQTRESKYNQIKELLDKKGYEVNRFFLGSEDGEAIMTKKKGSEAWHFLMHLDPNFVNATLDEILENLID